MTQCQLREKLRGKISFMEYIGPPLNFGKWEILGWRNIAQICTCPFSKQRNVFTRNIKNTQTQILTKFTLLKTATVKNAISEAFTKFRNKNTNIRISKQTFQRRLKIFILEMLWLKTNLFFFDFALILTLSYTRDFLGRVFSCIYFNRCVYIGRKNGRSSC